MQADQTNDSSARRSGGVSVGDLVAVLGGVVLAVGLLAFDWYFVDEADIPEPVEITSAGPANGSNFAAAVEATLAQGSDFPAEEPEFPPFEVITELEDFGAWDRPGPLGTLANLVMLAAVLASLGLAAARGAGARPELLVRSASLAAVLGAAATVAVVLRIIFPVEQINGFSFEAGYEAGPFVALAGALLVVVGGLLARREAREQRDRIVAPAASPRAGAAG